MTKTNETAQLDYRCDRALQERLNELGKVERTIGEKQDELRIAESELANATAQLEELEVQALIGAAPESDGKAARAAVDRLAKRSLELRGALRRLPRATSKLREAAMRAEYSTKLEVQRNLRAEYERRLSALAGALDAAAQANESLAELHSLAVDQFYTTEVYPGLGSVPSVTTFMRFMQWRELDLKTSRAG
jgi:hypothetical protein